MILAILLQARQSTSPAFNSGQAFGMACGLLILAAMVVGAIYVMVKWPKNLGGRFMVGAALLVLPFTGMIVVFIAVVTEAPLSKGTALLSVLGGWGIWLAIFVFARIVIRRDDHDRGHLATDRQAWQRVPDQPEQVVTAEPVGSVGPDASELPEFEQDPAPTTKGSAEPVIARCAACMGRWRTTKAEADALDACPKCGASPPDLRLQPAG